MQDEHPSFASTDLDDSDAVSHAGKFNKCFHVLSITAVLLWLTLITTLSSALSTAELVQHLEVTEEKHVTFSRWGKVILLLLLVACRISS